MPGAKITTGTPPTPHPRAGVFGILSLLTAGCGQLAFTPAQPGAAFSCVPTEVGNNPAVLKAVKSVGRQGLLCLSIELPAQCARLRTGSTTQSCGEGGGDRRKWRPGGVCLGRASCSSRRRDGRNDVCRLCFNRV